MSSIVQIYQIDPATVTLQNLLHQANDWHGWDSIVSVGTNSLLFYRKDTSLVQVYQADLATSTLQNIRYEHNNWHGWDNIVPVGTNSLLFYRKDISFVQVYQIDLATAGLQNVRYEHNKWHGWDIIVSIGTNSLLFYRKDTSLVQVYQVDLATACLQNIRYEHNNWNGWDNIVPVGTNCLLFYRKDINFVQVFQIDLATDWPGWDTIVSVGTNCLMFYRKIVSIVSNGRAGYNIVESDPDFPADYIKIKRISYGYWGETFQAKSKIDGKFYCIKRFYDRGGTSSKAFLREVQALSVLPHHPNILVYHHATMINGSLFTICEFLDAIQLFTQMPTTERPFNENLIWSWSQQLFDGIAHLHSTFPSIIHRDLTMTNILVKFIPNTQIPDIKPGSIKIIDVGNSKLLENPTGHTITDVGGTKSYFSPERISNKGYNHQDDVWAMACIISELVTGVYIRERLDAGSDGCLFATDSCIPIVQSVIEATRGKSERIGNVVEAILSERNPVFRPSASDIIRQYYSSS